MLEWLTLALSLGDKIADQLPDKEERKVNRYYKAKEEYLEELAKDYSERSDARVDALRMELFHALRRLGS